VHELMQRLLIARLLAPAESSRHDEQLTASGFTCSHELTLKTAPLLSSWSRGLRSLTQQSTLDPEVQRWWLAVGRLVGFNPQRPWRV
jgi:hypothetical protein